MNPRAALACLVCALASSQACAWNDCLALAPGVDTAQTILDRLPVEPWLQSETGSSVCDKHSRNVLVMADDNLCPASGFTALSASFEFALDYGGVLRQATFWLQPADDANFQRIARKLAKAYRTVPRAEWPPELLHDLAKPVFRGEEPHYWQVFAKGRNWFFLHRDKRDNEWRLTLDIHKPYRFKGYTNGVGYCAAEAEAVRKGEYDRRP